MKKTVIVTFLTAVAMVLVFMGIDSFFGKDDSTSIKAGFIYVGDTANPYTLNFIQAQKTIEAKYGDRVETVAKYNVSEGSESKFIQDLVDEGCDIIFGTSFGYADSFKQYAEENPDIEFVMATGTNANDEPVLSNYHTFMGRIYEGRYISGVVAGMKLKELIDSGEITEREALVGYVAAYPYAEVISGYTAFLMGVRSICPNVEMIVKYVNTWNGYSIEKECAEQLINLGCVIISQHSDTAGPAVACENYQGNHPVFLVSYNQSMIKYAPTTALSGCRINWTPYEVAAVGALLDKKSIEDALDKGIIVNGTDAGAGFDEGWVEMLELNKVIAADGTSEAIDKCILKFKKGTLSVFKGNYKGVNPYDSADTVDLNIEYKENQYSSAPTFGYILEDIVHIMN